MQPKSNHGGTRENSGPSSAGTPRILTTDELRAEVLDAVLPLQFLAPLLSAEIQLVCDAGSLAAAFLSHRWVTELCTPPDGAGEPIALDRVEVHFPGRRSGAGVRVRSRATSRAPTDTERATFARGAGA